LGIEKNPALRRAEALIPTGCCPRPSLAGSEATAAFVTSSTTPSGEQPGLSRRTFFAGVKRKALEYFTSVKIGKAKRAAEFAVNPGDPLLEIGAS